MYVCDMAKKKIGFHPFQQDQEITSHKQLQHSIAQDFTKQIEEGGKIILQTHLGSQQLSVHVDPRLFIQLPTDSQTQSTPLFYSVPQHRCTPRLCPLLYSLYAVDCISTHPSNTIIKFADDTTTVGLISNRDETAYRDEVCNLTRWCTENNLTLNIK